MRDIKPHAGVLVFEVTILPSGNLTNIRLLSEIDSESPWPTIAQRVKSAIADWRYEPVTVNNRVGHRMRHGCKVQPGGDVGANAYLVPSVGTNV